MRDPEHRALLRAAVLLMGVSVLRWGLVVRAHDPVVAEDARGDRLDDHLIATATAVDEEERRSLPLKDGERVDPNTAAEVELDRLPGIGPATAQAVVAARDSGVVFRRVDDLLLVRGIGPSSLARIRPWIAVPEGAPPSTSSSRVVRGARRAADPRWLIDVNRADVEALQGLPGVGPAIAARIVEERRVQPFASLDDLQRVKGIGPATVERLRRTAVAGRAR